MNKITATEYFQDYSEKYEEYEDYLAEIKEVIERCEEHLQENKRRFDYELGDLQVQEFNIFAVFFRQISLLIKNHHKTENLGLETVTLIMSTTDT